MRNLQVTIRSSSKANRWASLAAAADARARSAVSYSLQVSMWPPSLLSGASLPPISSDLWKTSTFLKQNALISHNETIGHHAKLPANVFDTPYGGGVKPRAQLDYIIDGGRPSGRPESRGQVPSGASEGCCFVGTVKGRVH